MSLQYNSKIHHRRSIRLPGYDYSQPGYYFVTICSYKRECIFGEVINYKMHLSAFGHLVKYHWKQITKKQNNIALDALIIMPNHIHAILIIKHLSAIGAINVGAIHELPLQRWAKRRNMVLVKIIGKYKMNTAKIINQHRDTIGCSVWQRNYFEHIIRDDEELFKKREYIRENPAKWWRDRNNIKKNKNRI